MIQRHGLWRERLGSLDLRHCPEHAHLAVRGWQRKRAELLKLEDDLLQQRHTPRHDPEPAAAA